MNKRLKITGFDPNSPVPVCCVCPNGEAVEVAVDPKRPVFFGPNIEFPVLCCEPNNEVDVAVFPKPEDAEEVKP